MAPAPAAPIRLTPGDAPRYAALRRRMLEDAPWAFAASPDDDRALDLEDLARCLAPDHRPAFAILAIEESPGGALVAAAGLARAARQKFAHRASVWGVFVEPAHRGRGHARALLEAVIALARTWPGLVYLDLGVSASSPEAQRLYEDLGFVAWGREPGATAWGEAHIDEIHMSLRLG